MTRIYQSQTWDVPLAGGVDEKSDPRYRNVPDIIRNAKYTKLGSLGKRPGSDCITPFANPNARQYGLPDATPGKLASCERGLLRYGRGEVDRVDDDKIESLRFVGETSWVDLERFSIGGRAFRDIDMSSNASGIYVGMCRPYDQNGAVASPFPIAASYVYGLDPTTLRPNGIEYIVDEGNTVDRLKLAPRGTKLWNVFRVQGQELDYATYDPATDILGTSIMLDATMSVTAPVDVWSDDPDALVIWGGDDGVYVAKLKNSDGLSYQSKIISYTAPLEAVSVSITRHPGTNKIAIAALMSTGTTETRTLNDTGAAFTTIDGPFLIPGPASATPRQVTIAGSSGTTNAFLVIDSQDVLWDVPEWVRRPVTTVHWTINGNPAPNSPTIVFQDTQILSEARLRIDRGMDGPRVFLWLRSVTDAWSSNLLMGINAPDTEAEFVAPLSGSQFHVEAVTAVLERTPPWSFTDLSDKRIASDDAPNVPSFIPRYTSLGIDNNTWMTPFLMGGVYLPATTTNPKFPRFEYGVDLSLTHWDFDSENVEWYGNSAICGGTVWIYDGANIREDGFFTAPPPAKLAAAGPSSAGQLTPGVKYGYHIVYYAEAGTGRASFSPPSTAVFVTPAGTQNQVNVTFPVPTVYSKDRDVTVEIYRTVRGGSTFFLVDRITVGPGTASAMTYTDNKSDQTVEAARTLYTTGGVLEYQTPPASEFIAFAQNRLWTIDDKGRVWFSDNIVDGEDPKFNTSYTIKAFSDEPLNAISGLDEKTLLFTPNEIWVTYGDGPDGTGAGGFAALYKLASDVGCVAPQAITQTPWGVFFQSRDGLCLVNRGLEVTRIGKPIEDTALQSIPNPVLFSSAVLVPKFSEVRFGVDDFFGAPDNSRSIGVVIDLFSGAPQKPVWYAYLWSNPFNPSTTINKDAAVYNNLYTWLDNNGWVFQDALGHFYDRATGRTDKWVKMEVESSFVNMAESEQAFARVWRTGFMYNLKTNVDVTLATRIDYQASDLQTQTFSASASQFFIDRRLMLRLKKQRVYAAKSTFFDAAPTGGASAGNGEGWQLAAVSFEGMVEGGMTRLPAGQKR